MNAGANGGGMGDMSAMSGMLEKDLGNIKLSIDNKQLEGVTVSATASKAVLAIDRKIFSVDKENKNAIKWSNKLKSP